MFDAIAGALRPPQSSAERRHRSPLADAGRSASLALTGTRARARSVHRHGGSRDRGADGAAAGGARGRRRFRRRDAAGRAARIPRARLGDRDRAGARRRDAHPGRRPRRSTPSRSRSASATSSTRRPRATRCTACCGPAAVSRFSSSRSRRRRLFRAVYLCVFPPRPAAHRPRSSRATTRRTATCRPRSARSPRPMSS